VNREKGKQRTRVGRDADSKGDAVTEVLWSAIFGSEPTSLLRKRLAIALVLLVGLVSALNELLPSHQRSASESGATTIEQTGGTHYGDNVIGHKIEAQSVQSDR
jgi:hypothetical protein